MNLSSRTPRIELLLHPHQVLNLDSREHRTAIECKNGVVWVTCAGEHQDHILQAGKSYVPRTNGSVVIQAIGESRVNIAEH